MDAGRAADPTADHTHVVAMRGALYVAGGRTPDGESGLPVNTALEVLEPGAATWQTVREALPIASTTLGLHALDTRLVLVTPCAGVDGATAVAVTMIDTGRAAPQQKKRSPRRKVGCAGDRWPGFRGDGSGHTAARDEVREQGAGVGKPHAGPQPPCAGLAVDRPQHQPAPAGRHQREGDRRGRLRRLSRR